MTYYSRNGDKITADQIKAAVDAGTARIIYSRGLNRTNSALSLVSDDFDTRGQCYQMSDEAWTYKPTFAEALKAAH